MRCDFNEAILVYHMEDNLKDIGRSIPLGGKGKRVNVHVQNIEDNEVDEDPMQMNSHAVQAVETEDRASKKLSKNKSGDKEKYGSSRRGTLDGD